MSFKIPQDKILKSQGKIRVAEEIELMFKALR